MKIYLFFALNIFHHIKTKNDVYDKKKIRLKY